MTKDFNIMKFNLLKFSNFPSHKGKYYLWLMIFIFVIVSIIFFLQIRNSKFTLLEQQNLNQKLQSDLLQLKNSFVKLKKKSNNSKKLKTAIESLQDREPKIVFETINISYANAVDIVLLIKEKEKLLSESGSIFADNRTNTILISDNSQEINKIKAMIKSLDVPQQQVLIEARVVNIERSSAEDLGIRFGFIQNQTKESVSSGDALPIKPNHANFDLSALPLEANPASIGLALATLGKNTLLDLELSALQSEGKAQIISSPRLITANQESAYIESGEDIPYQKISANGVASVSFKKAVLSLKVVPKITFDGKLIMSISINQDSDSGRRVQGIPIISTKALETKVMIDDNQTIVLGGIYKQDKNHSIIRVPILGTLPVFRWLFRRIEQKFRNEELLIFITPQIIAMK